MNSPERKPDGGLRRHIQVTQGRGRHLFPLGAYLVYFAFTLRLQFTYRWYDFTEHSAGGLDWYMALRVFAFALLGLYSLRWILRQMTASSPLRRTPARWTAAYLALAAASAAWSVSPALSFYRACELAAATCFAFWIANRAHGKASLHSVVLFLAIPMLVVGLADCLFGARPEGYYDVMPYFKHNKAGEIAAVVLLCGVHLALFGPSRKATRRGLWIAAGGGILTVLFESAAALGAAYVGLCILLYARRATRALVLVALVALTVAVLALMLGAMDSSLPEAAGVALRKEPEAMETFTGRFLLWKELLEMWKDKPLLGYGFSALRVMEIVTAEHWRARHAHSGYVAVLFGLGVVGFAALAIAIWANWSSMSRIGPFNRHLCASLFACLVVVNVASPCLGGPFRPSWLIWCVLTWWIALESRGAQEKGSVSAITAGTKPGQSGVVTADRAAPSRPSP